jgi:hypothetical protein
VRDAALQAIHKLKALEHVGFSRLARDSDVLFVLAPGGNETHHLVDAIFLRKMKPMSVLVDTGSVVSLCSNYPSVITDGPSFSRGSVVDSDGRCAGDRRSREMDLGRGA